MTEWPERPIFNWLSKKKEREYGNLLASIKSKIRSAQIKASISVNKAMLALYWDIGEMIIKKQAEAKWGDFLIEKLAIDLRGEFPDMKGFSRSNLFYIRQWVRFYSGLGSSVPQSVAQIQKVQQLVGQIPWGHNVLVVSKAKSLKEAEFYLKETITHNWSRSVLAIHIESDDFRRKGKLASNFHLTLPKPQSDLARETLKDPYNFDFLCLNDDALEREIEDALTTHITRFLLELGAGFAFVGRQFNLQADGKDFFIDLLFYHIKLRCYVAIELKAGEFKPDFAGQINFYLTALDETVKAETDNPSIGLILCKTRSKVIAEWSLRKMNAPIGISEFKLTTAIPNQFKPSLPSIEEIETELSKPIKKPAHSKRKNKK
jgi:predicted nuclease of restriction endonuclease-like (RecB) superfamily